MPVAHDGLALSTSFLWSLSWSFDVVFVVVFVVVFCRESCRGLRRLAAHAQVSHLPFAFVGVIPPLPLPQVVYCHSPIAHFAPVVEQLLRATEHAALSLAQLVLVIVLFALSHNRVFHDTPDYLAKGQQFLST